MLDNPSEFSYANTLKCHKSLFHLVSRAMLSLFSISSFFHVMFFRFSFFPSFSLYGSSSGSVSSVSSSSHGRFLNFLFTLQSTELHNSFTTLPFYINSILEPVRVALKASNSLINFEWKHSQGEQIVIYAYNLLHYPPRVYVQSGKKKIGAEV